MTKTFWRFEDTQCHGWALGLVGGRTLQPAQSKEYRGAAPELLGWINDRQGDDGRRAKFVLRIYTKSIKSRVKLNGAFVHQVRND
jgi:hypothetical protein